MDKEIVVQTTESCLRVVEETTREVFTPGTIEKVYAVYRGTRTLIRTTTHDEIRIETEIHRPTPIAGREAKVVRKNRTPRPSIEGAGT